MNPLIKKAVSVSTSLPAPIGGWNARDSLADMEPTDAVTMINWFPRTSDIQLRKGYSQFVTGIGNQVESLLQYSSPTSQKLFCVAGTSIFNVSTTGAVGAAVVTGLSNAKWRSSNISTSGGNFMYAVNGVDKPELYDGSTWVAVDGSSTPAITGVTTTNLVNVNLFKNRIWFVEKNTLKVWYLPTNSIGGAANSLDFQSIARRGGYLVAMGTWTIDAGYGVDDLAVFITSEGEVIVYRGTDPSSASTWAMVGLFQIGTPLGYKCLYKFAGDLLLITQDGIVPLSGALQSSRTNPKVALTDKIQSAISDSATLYGSNFGWQIIYYAKANMLILNVPVSVGDNQEQYVMNTITKAWARFQGFKANCWEIFQDEPYFGGNGFVGKVWSVLNDNGAAITSVGKQAFNYFDSHGIIKRFTMIRPVILTNGSPSIWANLNVDFDDTGATSLLTFSPQSSGLWDIGMWDSAIWGPDNAVSNAWQGATGIGYCAAPRLEASAMGINLYWVSTDVVMEKGGIL